MRNYNLPIREGHNLSTLSSDKPCTLFPEQLYIYNHKTNIGSYNPQTQNIEFKYNNYYSNLITTKTTTVPCPCPSCAFQPIH